MKAISLQSGSNGNCIYVEASGVRLLVDAGISARETGRRLECLGCKISDIHAVLVSHEHVDHTSSVGTLCNRYGIPTYMTPATEEALCRKAGCRCLQHVRHFSSGSSLAIGPVKVETIPTSHDAVDGNAFVIEDQGFRLGVLTDLGHVFGGLEKVVGSLDALFLESNYDPGMLKNGCYPAFLKKRIAGPGGHISNDESARLISATGKTYSWVCLAHLSQANNTPELAVATHMGIAGSSQSYHVAPRNGMGEELVVRKAVEAGRIDGGFR